MAGDRVVIPGRLNGFRVFLRRLLPRRLYVKTVKRAVTE
jgi:hypothetical protein